MQRVLFFVDRVSSLVGQAFSWLIVALTFLISWEVFARYVLNKPNPWAFDLMIMMYGAAFMMAGAYTLATNGHVRGDVLYSFFPPRLQAGLDLILYFVFFIPGVVALVWAGYTYAEESFAIREHSTLTANGPPLAYGHSVFLPHEDSLDEGLPYRHGGYGDWLNYQGPFIVRFFEGTGYAYATFDTPSPALPGVWERARCNADHRSCAR